MQVSHIPFPQVGPLAKTDVAYATEHPALQPFYQYAPQLASFRQAIADRAGHTYPRADLVAVLREQYARFSPTLPFAQIDALLDTQTYTVTTAHQPSLLLGPLYFLYKALTTINLAAAVAKETGHRIVPVFVLGSEDHDLAELNAIQLFGKRLVWEPNQSGAVGSMDAATLKPVLEALRPILGENANAQTLLAILEKAYGEASTFADATQRLLDALLGRFGLVVLNMNDHRLKQHFVPIMQAELTQQVAQQHVSVTIAQLQAAGFKAQAMPREINLFYLTPTSRARLVRTAHGFETATANEEGVESGQIISYKQFFDEEILSELNKFPEKFSPNVVLRPVFQELVLPNLAYVGGGGELAYWLERKALFAHLNVPYPILIRRHSVLWMDADASKKWEKWGFSVENAFEDGDALVRRYVATHAETNVDLTAEKAALNTLFEQIAQKAQAVDATLEKAARADAVKTAGLLDQWESRLLRTEKQKYETTLNQIRAQKEKWFPQHGLQERTDNFIPYFLKYGDGFLDTLKANLQPFAPGFVVLQP